MDEETILIKGLERGGGGGAGLEESDDNTAADDETFFLNRKLLAQKFVKVEFQMRIPGTLLIVIRPPPPPPPHLCPVDTPSMQHCEQVS